jgi:hypothetical protein
MPLNYPMASTERKERMPPIWILYSDHKLSCMQVKCLPPPLDRRCDQATLSLLQVSSNVCTFGLCKQH